MDSDSENSWCENKAVMLEKMHHLQRLAATANMFLTLSKQTECNKMFALCSGEGILIVCPTKVSFSLSGKSGCD